MPFAHELLQQVPDRDGVSVALDANDQTLIGLYNAIGHHTRELINHNTLLLAPVEKRLRSSIGGHIRRNTQNLKPVVQWLYDQVYNGLDANQASINMVVSRPDVQAWLATNPPQPAWAGIIPTPPKPGELAEGIQPAASGNPLMSIPRRKIRFEIFIHCEQKQVAALPEPSRQDRILMHESGFAPVPDGVVYLPEDKAAVEAYLSIRKGQLLALCNSPL